MQISPLLLAVFSWVYPESQTLRVSLHVPHQETTGIGAVGVLLRQCALLPRASHTSPLHKLLAHALRWVDSILRLETAWCTGFHCTWEALGASSQQVLLLCPPTPE